MSEHGIAAIERAAFLAGFAAANGADPLGSLWFDEDEEDETDDGGRAWTEFVACAQSIAPVRLDLNDWFVRWQARGLTLASLTLPG